MLSISLKHINTRQRRAQLSKKLCFKIHEKCVFLLLYQSQVWFADSSQPLSAARAVKGQSVGVGIGVTAPVGLVLGSIPTSAVSQWANTQSPAARHSCLLLLSLAEGCLQQWNVSGPEGSMNGPQLSELPDDSEQLRPYVSRLRRGALRAGELSAVGSLSSGFLLRFLRARDFNTELSLKVRAVTESQGKTCWSLGESRRAHRNHTVRKTFGRADHHHHSPTLSWAVQSWAGLVGRLTVVSNYKSLNVECWHCSYQTACTLTYVALFCGSLSNGKAKVASHVIEFAPVLQVLVHTSLVACDLEQLIFCWVGSNDHFVPALTTRAVKWAFSFLSLSPDCCLRCTRLIILFVSDRSVFATSQQTQTCSCVGSVPCPLWLSTIAPWTNVRRSAGFKVAAELWSLVVLHEHVKWISAV